MEPLILSAYTLSTGVKVWVITEADRSATTFLLPLDSSLPSGEGQQGDGRQCRQKPPPRLEESEHRKVWTPEA